MIHLWIILDSKSLKKHNKDSTKENAKETFNKFKKWNKRYSKIVNGKNSYIRFLDFLSIHNL